MKIQCPCGELIYDGGDGLMNKAHFIADQDWERFWDEVDAAVEKSGPSVRDKEAACMRLRGLRMFRLAWQCTNCGRLHLDDTPTMTRTFAPEPAPDDASTSVFSRRAG
jgi:hypothetical protein